MRTGIRLIAYRENYSNGDHVLLEGVNHLPSVLVNECCFFVIGRWVWWFKSIKWRQEIAILVRSSSLKTTKPNWYISVGVLLFDGLSTIPRVNKTNQNRETTIPGWSTSSFYGYPPWRERLVAILLLCWYVGYGGCTSIWCLPRCIGLFAGQPDILRV